MPRVFFILQSLFSLWMLIDAFRRGGRTYWYWIILLPFGEVAYFFMVKIHDPEFAPLREFYHRLTTKKVTLAERRFRLEQTPSFTNTCTLAQALYDEKLFAEALDMFRRALELRGDAKDALYGLGLTHLQLGEHGSAIDRLRELIATDPVYENYSPWADLADALVRDKQIETALELLSELVRKSPRMNHHVLFAHYLLHTGRVVEGERQLEAALIEYDHLPRFLKRRQRAWAGRAKKMLRQCRSTSSGTGFATR